jgi:hypothetical protein
MSMMLRLGLTTARRGIAACRGFTNSAEKPRVFQRLLSRDSQYISRGCGNVAPVDFDRRALPAVI